MIELNIEIARLEMRLEQLIIHVRENKNAAEAEVEACTFSRSSKTWCV